MDLRVVVDKHSAEFEKFELSSILTYSLLAKENRAFRCQFYEQGNNGECRKKRNERDQAAKDVHGSFKNGSVSFRRVLFRKVGIKNKIPLVIRQLAHLLRKDTEHQG